MKKSGDICLDVEGIATDIRQLENLLNLVIDDLEDNGRLEGRRELTASALYIIMDHLGLLADKQMDIAGRLWDREAER